MIKKLISLSLILLLLFAFSMAAAGEAENGGTPQPIETSPPTETSPPPVETTPPVITPTQPVETSPPIITPTPTETTPTPTTPPREYPAWFRNLDKMPGWVYWVDEFPDWFYDLKSEPVWFWEIVRIPAWFYTLTSIPDWFYASEDADPENDPEDDPGRDPFEPPGDIEVLPPEDPNGELPGGDDRLPDDIYEYSATPFEQIFSGGSFFTSIPSGLIVSESVFFTGDYSILSITRDGQPIEWLGGSLFEHGLYVVSSLANPDTELFSFRIITNPVNVLEYAVPLGFVLREVSYEGENLVVIDRQLFVPEHDGAYVFTVSSLTDENQVFYARISLKTNPPTVYFEGLSEDMTAEGPVAYWTDEPDVFISIMLNDREISATGTVSEAGSYVLTATDIAGNTSTYFFRIFYSMNSAGVWIIIIFAVLVAGVLGYTFYSRKKKRVR